MVMEFRRLVFAPAELARALEVIRSANASALPAGQIKEVVIVDEPQVCVHVRMGVPGSTEECKVVVDVDVLAAAMLRFCMNSKIPIPRAAKKTVVRAGDGLALSFSINASRK